MELIDKTALITEIKRLRDTTHELFGCSQFDTAYDNVLKSINSFEVKEVDFKKALDDYVYKKGLVNCYEITPIAKYFFELCIKAKQD